MGLLDLPAPLLDALDGVLTWIGVPALLRVMLAGLVAGAAGAWVYRRYSPQARLGALRAELGAVQAELRRYDGPFSGLMPLIRRQFALSLRQLRITAGAAVLAGLPALLILPWLSNRYDVAFPPSGTPVHVCAEPAEVAWTTRDPALTADAQGCLDLPWPAAAQPVPVREDDRELITLPTPQPARIVHDRRWFNWLIGNPAGYLPDQVRMRQLRLDLPSRELIAVGPAWLRGWEAGFFTAALLSSLWLHRRWRLH
ncbi:MAG: hypothetical protein DI564_13975 [Rhodanobacter denitrificans]|uniref:Uncharacterized protein n=1 Tax=Rhodanobacter denitrificans TaxID=666685 RepID=A0A2W5LXJ7_9GAMM|nr:MAG: hypothetical protein DI564_13975 [Rhodanobacter denitrificans]